MMIREEKGEMTGEGGSTRVAGGTGWYDAVVDQPLA
jgi:hypothetical protein